MTGHEIKVLEILDLVLGLSVLASVFVMVLVVINKVSGPKKATKKGDNSISDLYDVYNTQVTDILKIKDTQISSLTSKLKRLEAQTYEEEPESNGKEIKYEDLTALVKTKYPKLAPLMLVFKKQIKEATKGMDIEEILGYVQQFTENKEPGSTSNAEPVEYRKDWA